MTKTLCVVKRRREKQCHKYDERKVYGSTYAACYVVRIGEKKCEKVADMVAKAVTKHVSKKKMIKAHDIAQIAAKELRKHSKAAAFMYETHRDIS